MPRLEPLKHRSLTLNADGLSIPALGFGTLIPDPDAAKRAIMIALKVGFRHFDTAELYRNEDIVGAALREAFEAGIVRREELFVTAKLWNNNHRPQRVGPALAASLRRLGLDYVDSYLIHTPFAFPPTDEQHPRDEQGRPVYDAGVTLAETWRAMEGLVDDGKARSIGLSDIRLEKLQEICASARIKPSVIQVESHPYLPEWELLEFCKQNGIVLTAFAPLGHGMEPRVTEDPVIAAIASRLGRTPAQVALAWAIQRGTAILTTSTNPDHIRENFEVADLPDDALREIGANIATTVRFNMVVDTGVPGFVPRRA